MVRNCLCKTRTGGVGMRLFELEQRKDFPYITGLYGLESYAAAYWRAAKGLIENGLFDGCGRPDFSTFPIVFLYRHAMELMLKAVLIEHHEPFSRNPEKLLFRGHKLKTEYLADLRSVVEKAGVFTTGEPVLDITPEQWSQLQTVLVEWQQHDPDGMAFRYSCDKKARKALTTEDFTFNIEQFSQVMDETLETLDEIKSALDHLRYQDILSSEGMLV